MSRRYFYGVNRTICDALEEMRSCNKMRNYALLESLVEEIQLMANRMEAALDDVKDIRHLKEERGDLKKEVMALRKESAKLNKKLGKKEKEQDFDIDDI